MSDQYYDARETRSGDEREQELSGRLAAHIGRVIADAPGWARHLSGYDAAAITSRAALTGLPVLRKHELMERQAENPPFGGFRAGKGGGRVFMSPGPIYEPQGQGKDPWNVARACWAAGFRPGDIIHNSFSYSLTPGGLIMDSGARAVGCEVFPAGTGNTENQVQAMAALRPAGYTGTPDFLKVLLDEAEGTGRDVSSLSKALVSGGALFPAMREDYARRGVRVLQCYATADLGVIAYESEAMEGMIVNEDLIVEIVTPGTGDPVPEGEIGELVVTNFNSDYPMIRFATGDLSALLPGASPCGRTNMRIKGWLGRADQTTKIKGMFVHPEQVALIARNHLELGRLRLTVSRRNDRDVMCLVCECAAPSEELAAKVAASVKEVTKLRGEVELVAPGSLPLDGKVIDDQRDYS